MHTTRVIGVLEPGGAQLSALRLARAQTALGVRTTLVAGDATPQGVALARHYGFEVAAFAVHDQVSDAPRQWTPDPAFADWLRPLLHGCDLVHAHMFGAWWAAAVSAPPGVPVIASEHNAIRWPLGDHTREAMRAADRVDLFFVHGPEARTFLHDLGVPGARVREGRSAISLYAEPRPGLVSPRLTFTGRLREDKGPDLLLDALASMTDPPTTYLVGDGPMAGSLRRRIEGSALRRTVHMPGWSHEPARYVAGAAVHVVPSREEAWSQSAVTALALGVPVVATGVEGLPITLAEGRGLVVPPEDPAALAAGIRAVLDGDVRLDAAAGRRYAARFRAPEIASDYFADYQSLIVRRASGPVLRPTWSAASS